MISDDAQRCEYGGKTAFTRASLSCANENAERLVNVTRFSTGTLNTQHSRLLFMPDLVVTLLISALAIQFPIGIFMYLDAKRLDLKNPELYWLGVIVPAGGFAVVLYYLSERKTLPKNEPETT